MYGLLAFVTVLSAPAVQRGEPRTRDVQIERAAFFHSEAVVGELNTETTLEFPEPIVLMRCSDCEEIREDLPTADAGAPPPISNWVATRDAKQRPGMVHLTPAEIPSASNPIEAFSSTITVLLASRHKVHIQLSLRDPRSADRTAFDHWVSFKIPDTETTSAQVEKRVAEQTSALKERFDATVTATVAQFFLRHPRCTPKRWVTPQAEAKTRVWVTELCITKENPHAYVALFAVENTGSSLLTLREAQFEPNGSFTTDAEPAVYTYLPNTPVAFGQQAQGVAIYEVPKGHSQPPSWTLRVQPESRPAVVIGDIVFGHVHD